MAGNDFFAGIDRIYGRTIDEHGIRPEGLRYEAGEQEHFFRLIVDTIGADAFVGKRILDVGCGFADLARYLEQRLGGERFSYCGIDVCRRAADAARASQPGRDIRCGSVFDLQDSGRDWDLTLAIGVFSPIGNPEDVDENIDNFKRTFAVMHELARDLVAFNLIRRLPGEEITAESPVYCYDIDEMAGYVRGFAHRSLELVGTDFVNADGDVFFFLRK